MIEEIRKTLVECDSLLSLLVHRHGSYMEKIGEIEEATRLYRLCRELSTAIDFSSLPQDKRTEEVGE